MKAALITEEQIKAIEDALEDMLSGWKYIRESHGDLYGIGWDRAESKAVKALTIVRSLKVQEPVAWVEGLEKPQPRCVTNLNYRSVAETKAGVQFIPLYTSPQKREWQELTDEDWHNLPTSNKQGCERDAEIFNWIENKLKEKNT